MPYSGLLEKCPANTFYDATVTEDGGYGVKVRRREQYSTFDREVYRAWGRGPLSGWTKTRAIRTVVLMFSHFHQVFIRFSPEIREK